VYRCTLLLGVSLAPLDGAQCDRVQTARRQLNDQRRRRQLNSTQLLARDIDASLPCWYTHDKNTAGISLRTLSTFNGGAENDEAENVKNIVVPFADSAFTVVRVCFDDAQDYVIVLETVSALVSHFVPSCATADFEEASVSAFQHVFFSGRRRRRLLVSQRPVSNQTLQQDWSERIVRT